MYLANLIPPPSLFVSEIHLIRKQFCTLWKDQTCRMLNKARNYVQGQIFDKVKDYVRTYGEGKFPTLEEIELIVTRDPLLLPPAAEPVCMLSFRTDAIPGIITHCAVPHANRRVTSG